MTIGSPPRRVRSIGTSMHRQVSRVPSTTTGNTTSFSTMPSTAKPGREADGHRHVDEIACVAGIARLPVSRRLYVSAST